MQAGHGCSENQCKPPGFSRTSFLTMSCFSSWRDQDLHCSFRSPVDADFITHSVICFLGDFRGKKLPFHASIFLCEIKGYQHFTFPLKWSETEIRHRTLNNKKELSLLAVSRNECDKICLWHYWPLESVLKSTLINTSCLQMLLAKPGKSEQLEGNRLAE